VFISSTNTSRPWRTLAKRAEQSATSLLLTAGLAATGLLLPVSALSARAQMAPEANSSASTEQALADGTYLYGQSQQPEQIGSAYMVFEVDQGKVVGAFYMPHSSFDCFYGRLEADRVALNVVNSYEQTVHSYDVALETSAPIAMAGDQAIAPIGLEGFHLIEAVSSNDQRILSTCKESYQDQM
jgi:hypothetical protein